MDRPINQNIENILLNNIRGRVEYYLGEAISSEVENVGNSKDIYRSAETCIDDIVDKISALKTFSLMQTEFTKELDDILNRENVDFVELCLDPSSEYKNIDSVMGSISSLNSSIDFLSTDQLNEIVRALVSPSVTVKLEGLGTLCRLSTLEHITKQSLWPEIEAGLHSLMTSSISFLQDGSLSVFIKMLSSPEPQVVRESFVSLIQITRDILLSFRDQIYDGETTHFKFVERVLKVINKFQKCIPNRWLRYPYKVIDDIICHSVMLLNIQSTFFWNIITSFDLGAKWLKNLMYGCVSRLMLLSAFEKELTVLKYISAQLKPIDFECDVSICCNSRDITSQIHAICFMSQFVQYGCGRTLLNELDGEINGWQSVVKNIVLATKQLCENVCFKCFLPLQEAVPQICYGLKKEEEISFMFATVTREYFCEPETDLHKFNYGLLANILMVLIQSQPDVLSDIKINDHDVHAFILHCYASVMKSLDLQLPESVHVMKLSIALVKVLVSTPVDTSKFPSILCALTTVFQNVNELVYEEGPGAHVSDKIVNDLQLVFLRKPIGIALCQNSNFYNNYVSFLLKGLQESIYGNYVMCSCVTGTLINLFGYNFRIDNDYQNVTELCTVLHRFYSDYNCIDNNTSIKNTIKVIITSLFHKFSHQYSNEDTTDMIKYILFQSNDADFLWSEEDNVLLSLNILSIIIFDVSICCSLQGKFKVQQLLIKLLSDYVSDEGYVIITPVSILLNYIISKLYSVSGPSEIELPVKDIINLQSLYDVPFVLSYPLMCPLPEATFIDNDVQPPEFDTLGNLSDVQNIFLSYCQSEEACNSHYITKIVKQFTYFETEMTLSLPNSEIEFIMNRNIKSGINLASRYAAFCGNFINMLESDLIEVIEKCVSLSIIPNNDYFDVFVATIYLLFECNLNVAWEFLHQFSQCQSSLFVWQQRGIHLSKTNEQFHFNQPLIMECCDLLVMKCLPTVFRAFQKCSLQPSVMFSYWIGQCFWNYLDWPEICNFVALTIIFGGEYALYYFVAVLSHLQMTIKERSYHGDIVTHLKGTSIKGFYLSLKIDFIIELASKYEMMVKNIIDHMMCDNDI